MATVILVSVLVFLLVFTACASWRDNYRHEDRPVEMLDYAQISYDVPKIMEQIKDMARQTGKGKELKITLDTELSALSFYLKGYKLEVYAGRGEPKGDVLLLAPVHEAAARQYLDKYDK